MSKDIYRPKADIARNTSNICTMETIRNKVRGGIQKRDIGERERNQIWGVFRVEIMIKTLKNEIQQV